MCRQDGPCCHAAEVWKEPENSLSIKSDPWALILAHRHQVLKAQWRCNDTRQLLKWLPFPRVGREAEPWEVSPPLRNKTQRLKREMIRKTQELKSRWSPLYKYLCVNYPQIQT